MGATRRTWSSLLWTRGTISSAPQHCKKCRPTFRGPFKEYLSDVELIWSKSFIPEAVFFFDPAMEQESLTLVQSEKSVPVSD